MRSIPLCKSTVLKIRAWLRLNPALRGEAPLLPNRDGQAMCRSNVTQRLSLAVARATAEQPSLAAKRVSPHTLRHTSAMHLLQSGVPFNAIALWLGHESTTTTHRYVEADLAMKEHSRDMCIGVGRVSSLLLSAVIRPAASASYRKRPRAPSVRGDQLRDDACHRQVSEWTGRSPRRPLAGSFAQPPTFIRQNRTAADSLKPQYSQGPRNDPRSMGSRSTPLMQRPAQCCLWPPARKI